MSLILASASPRRQELLRQIGVRFQVRSADIDETQQTDESPADYVQRMAIEKARVIARLYPEQAVLAADTIVVLGNEVFTKPANTEQAKSTLARLSGQTHQVLTAVCLIQGAQQHTLLDKTQVTFLKLNSTQIEAYVATGEPLDKAGAYGIQGFGAVLVSRIEGCYNTVVGLPLAKIAGLLEQFHLPIWQQD